MPVNTAITLRKGSASQWSTTNPILASGEPGYDLTNNILKIGDGVSNWNSLNSINFSEIDLGTYPLITITSQPVSVSGYFDEILSFSVVATSTLPARTLYYQWQKSSDNISFNNIINQNTSILTFNTSTNSDNGYYRCLLTSDFSIKYSNSVQLTVAPRTSSFSVSPSSGWTGNGSVSNKFTFGLSAFNAGCNMGQQISQATYRSWTFTTANAGSLFVEFGGRDDCDGGYEVANWTQYNRNGVISSTFLSNTDLGNSKRRSIAVAAGDSIVLWSIFSPNAQGPWNRIQVWVE